MTRRYRLAYLVSHPIQYQAPMLRAIAADPGIDLTAYFLSDFSVRPYWDVDMRTQVTWDVPLLEGYHHEFLPAVGGTQRLSAWRPWSIGLRKRLAAGRYDALWLHGYSHPTNLRALMVARSLGIKVFIRSDVHMGTARRSSANRRIKETLLRLLFAQVDGFLAIGTLNRQYFEHYGAPPDRIFSVPYCVDNDFFRSGVEAARPKRQELRAELQLQGDRPVILFASKLQRIKRADDLLEAYCRLSPDGRREPEPYLIYVGDGERREALEARARETGWSSIRFLGFKNQSELPRYFDLCDVFVHVGETEAWALILNEVMNAAKPIVVSDQVGAGPDLVREGENGYVIRLGDVEALRDRLALLTTDRSRAEQMGRKSRDLIDAWTFQEDVVGLKRALRTVVGPCNIE